jgi:hypothetical protein
MREIDGRQTVAFLLLSLVFLLLLLLLPVPGCTVNLATVVRHSHLAFTPLVMSVDAMMAATISLLLFLRGGCCVVIAVGVCTAKVSENKSKQGIMRNIIFTFAMKQV